MFDWFKRKRAQPFRAQPPNAPVAPPPASAAAQPSATQTEPRPAKGQPPPGGMDTVGGRSAFANGQRTWTEEFDVMRTAAAALQAQGHKLELRERSIILVESGMVLTPRMQAMQPIHPKGAQTTATVQCSHPTFGAFGIYEYQHSAGSNIEDSLLKGFEQWAQIDLAVLLDALRDKPKVCMIMQAEFPPDGERAKRTRRGVMGPVAHVRQQKSRDTEEHPFCACCFFTQTIATFDRFFKEDGFYAIRFFGARDEKGNIQADCRVNGDEFEEGKAAIRNYVSAWPNYGFEFRKQYVVFQDWAASHEKQWRE